MKLAIIYPRHPISSFLKKKVKISKSFCKFFLGEVLKKFDEKKWGTHIISTYTNLKRIFSWEKWPKFAGF